MTPLVVLTIAGSDPSGGAGIQADLKTFSALDCYGTSVITAVTSQNTVEVSDVFPMPGNVVSGQLSAVLDDFSVKAVKVGMLASGEIAGAVAARARAGDLPNLVLDPVLTASTGRRLGVVTAIERLLPYVTVLTPNMDEASALVGWPVTTLADMAGAAAQLAAKGAQCVVITGGDVIGDEAVDTVWLASSSGAARQLRAPKVKTKNTHGTGCTFSSAIAARLAHGYSIEDSIDFAKRYVRAALIGAQGWELGRGAGPLNHLTSELQPGR